NGIFRTVQRKKVIVGIEKNLAHNRKCLIAAIAHELGHILLIGDNRLSASREDHEQLTDLLTVFLGLGIFNANAAIETFSYNKYRGVGVWIPNHSTSKNGYLSEPMFASALALFAWLRGEERPAWTVHLDDSVRADFVKGLKYLEKTSNSLVKPEHLE